MVDDMEMDDRDESPKKEESKKTETHKKHEHKKHDSNKEYMEHKEHKHHKTFEAAAWTLGVVAIVLAALLVASIFTKGFSGSTTSSVKGISEDELRTKTAAYLEKVVQGQTVSIDSITDEGDMYTMKLNIGGRPYDSYARKDGSILFPSGLNMNEAVATTPTDTPAQTTEVPKTDKPTVELFVMSHCPFGTQAEKGILPAVRALGDKVDFKIKFVYYAMHGEKEVKEQLTQYCIQSEQQAKYIPYLACFLNDSAGQGSESASNACITSLGIDKTKLESCKTATDTKFNVMKNFNDQTTWLSGRFPLFDTDKEANTKYSVGGSPTLVINGVNSNAGRDSVSYLNAICNAMTTKAPECNTQLSATPPGAGFGYDSVGAAQAAGCGV